MCYLKTELNKMKRSNLLKGSIVFILIFSVLYYLINSITTPEISTFKFIYRSFSILAYFPLLIPPVIFTSLLFGKEYQDRTMLYIFLRPIKYKALFISKILASCYYSILIVIGDFLLTVIYGILFFHMERFEFDTTIMQSVIRCTFLLFYTCVGVVLVTVFTALINTCIRNMFGSGVITMIIWALCSIIVFKLNINSEIFRIPITTYLNPAQYYDVTMNKFLTIGICVTLLNMLVIAILIRITYTKSLKFRKGIKQI